MIVARFSLCGMPFISGYYSKDKILEFIFLRNFPLLIKFLVYFRIILTIIYTFRIIQFLRININRFTPIKSWVESKLINISMLILLILRLLFGFLIK
jgi:NADH:ubiquinone oxidoreductase subunit 5 (subunit L)/multisubunit Na+/H+ antiporter MnhA subunit